MTRDELIERMARDIAQNFFQENWDSLNAFAMKICLGMARAALGSLCQALPGLSYVIDGKAVIVPVEATVEMVSAFWRQKNTGTQEIGTERADHRDDFSAYTAMINARPK